MAVWLSGGEKVGMCFRVRATGVAPCGDVTRRLQVVWSRNNRTPGP